MESWKKSIGIALLVFVGTYIAYNILCALVYGLSHDPSRTPVPALITGLPIGLIAASIYFIFAIVRRDSN